MSTGKTILLFGMPRSGTTWIGKIFDSHDGTLYRHEPDTRKKIYQIPMLEEQTDAGKYCEFVNQYLANFVNDRDVSVNGKLPLFPKQYSSYIQYEAFYLSTMLAGVASKLSKKINLPVLHPVNLVKTDDYVVVWKSIQLLGRMGIIADCIDNCRAIHILRHPCGYIASVQAGERMKKFVSHTAASEDWNLYSQLMKTSQALRYDLTLEKMEKMSPEERLAWRWVIFNEKASDDTQNNPYVMKLRYEDMCSFPVETAKACFEFCELDWCDQTESFLGVSTRKTSDSYYSVYKDPMIAANKWQSTLSDDQISAILKVVKSTRIGSYYFDTD
ncbi:MAG: sulfotransferase [Sedimenticola sp.]